MPRFTHPPHAQTNEERVQQTADDIVRGFGHRRLGHKQQYALRRMRINLLTGAPSFARYYPDQVVMRTLLGRELVLKIGTSTLPSWQEWSLTPLGEAVARRLEG